MHRVTRTGECICRCRHASLLCVLFLATYLLSGCSSESAVYVTAETQASDAVESELSDTSASDEEAGGAVEEADSEWISAQEDTSLCVFVCGAVESPGVYTLAAGSRVCDAIEAAGGFSEDASQDYWNQAEYVSDGQMIDVPTEAEVQSGQAAASTEATASGMDSGESDDSSGKININTATLEELTQISGIGEARAEAIIRYREENGAFSCIEDIKNVSGIGDGLFEKMQDEIVAD